MKTILLAALCGILASCSDIRVVNNRNPDGTFNTPSCTDGSKPTRSATIYQCADGSLMVSVWSDDGTAPKLQATKL